MNSGTDFAKRKYLRVVYTASADISPVKNPGFKYSGIIKNISLGGIAVETENELAVGGEFSFAFLLSGRKRIKASGKIIWEYKDKNSNNYGVQFTRIDFLSRFRLKRFMEERLKI